jgi:hypothetical protein
MAFRPRSSSSLPGLAVACAALLASSAFAYRPQAGALLDKAMAAVAERGTRSLKVEATVQLYGAQGTPRGERLAERVWVATPGALRRETEGDDGVVVEVRAEGRSLLRAPGQPDKTGKAGVDVLLEALASGSPDGDRLLAALKALGVNTEVTSFARFDGRVAVLVGSKPWETDQPQAWFDKDTLLPVRVVTLQKEPDGNTVRHDVRYLGWGSPVGGNWYPASIEVWRGDRLVRRSVTQTVERNVAIDAERFSLR